MAFAVVFGGDFADDSLFVDKLVSILLLLRRCSLWTDELRL